MRNDLGYIASKHAMPFLNHIGPVVEQKVVLMLRSKVLSLGAFYKQILNLGCCKTRFPSEWKLPPPRTPPPPGIFAVLDGTETTKI